MGNDRYTIIDEDNKVVAADMNFDTASILLRALFDLYYDMPRKYTIIKETPIIKVDIKSPMEG